MNTLKDYWEYSELLEQLERGTRLKVTFASGNTRYGFGHKPYEMQGWYLTPRGNTVGWLLGEDVTRKIEKKVGNKWELVWEKL